jgi:hypothetical protein
VEFGDLLLPGLHPSCQNSQFLSYWLQKKTQTNHIHVHLLIHSFACVHTVQSSPPVCQIVPDLHEATDLAVHKLLMTGIVQGSHSHCAYRLPLHVCLSVVRNTQQ